MKTQSNHASPMIKLLTLHSLLVLSTSQSYDFFYLVYEWPGSICNTEQVCCFPTTGDPEYDFAIRGFWPALNNGSTPTDCDSSSPFNASLISDDRARMEVYWPTFLCPSSDGLSFWGNEWVKHGTCSESIVDQATYFWAPLQLKSKIEPLQVLMGEGDIPPDGKTYTLDSIKHTFEEATDYIPGIVCNKDSSGNILLYQIYLCVDSIPFGYIDCPVFPDESSCGSSIVFPSFKTYKNVPIAL